MALLKQKRTSWVIAHFVQSQTYSVVPKIWIFQTTDNSGQLAMYSKWPPGADEEITSEIIKKATIPSNEWLSYKIRLFDDGKEYYNFSKAWHKKIDYIKSTTENEDYQNSSKKLKVNIVQDSESDTEDDTAFNVTPMTQTERDKNNFNVQNVEFINDIQSSKNASNDSELNCDINAQHIASISNYQCLPSTSFTEMTNVTSATCNSSAVCSNMCNDPMITLNENHLESMNIRYRPNPVFDGSNLSNMMEILSKISKDQTIIKLMQERMLSKMETIEVNLKSGKHNYASSSTFLDANFLSYFPICSSKMFLIVENLIINNEEFVKKLEYFIKQIGGCDLKNYIKRSFGKLFNDEFGTQCTLTGRGKNITIKIGGTELLKNIKRVIKKAMVDKVLVTDSEFERIVVEWFRYSSTRLFRSNTNNSSTQD